MENNKRRNYYRNHNNNNNHYYKKKKKKVLEIDDNILLSYTGPIKKVYAEQKETISIDDNLEDINFIPQKKEKSFFKSKSLLKYSSALVIFVIFVFGISYSFFNYYSESNREAGLSTAEVYVRVLENKVTLTLPRMYPMTAADARSRNDNYVDFTLVGKNTSETKKIIYNLLISNGADVTGKTRIAPAYLKLDLQELVNNQYESIISEGILSNYSYSGQVLPGTTIQIERHFRLRVWVSDEVLISDTDPNAIYTQSEFSNLYATLSIDVSSNDALANLGVKQVRDAITAKVNAQTNACNPVWVDDMGTSSDETDDITYFSGTNSCVDMNYVWYSGKLWRITAIYPDGSMKLVTENKITSISFNESQVNFYTDANTTSYMYQWLNEDFYDTLYHASEFIDTTKLWNATNSNALLPDEVSTRLSETTMVSANVGLLNSYEFYNSHRDTDYFNDYLISNSEWWLLNPFDSSHVWVIEYGMNETMQSPNTSLGVRPSIVIKSGIEFTGSGTRGNPYKIVGDKETGNTNDLVNTRISGEYVKLKNENNEQLFRIIGIEDNKTKIIAMDYADNEGSRKFATSIGSANTLWGSGTTTGTDTWYDYLNNTYLPNLKNIYGELFDSNIYYLGTSGYNYKLSVCANTTSGNTEECDKVSSAGTFNIGLPRYGEMFATMRQGSSGTFWLMNRYSSLNVWVVSTGTALGAVPRNDYNARPTVHLKSTVKILSGSGTESDPYVVGL